MLSQIRDFAEGQVFTLAVLRHLYESSWISGVQVKTGLWLSPSYLE
jgi:hypothetical protein